MGRRGASRSIGSGCGLRGLDEPCVFCSLFAPFMMTMAFLMMRSGFVSTDVVLVTHCTSPCFPNPAWAPLLIENQKETFNFEQQVNQDMDYSKVLSMPSIKTEENDSPVDHHHHHQLSLLLSPLHHPSTRAMRTEKSFASRRMTSKPGKWLKRQCALSIRRVRVGWRESCC